MIPLSSFRPNPFLSRAQSSAARTQLYNARTLTTNHTFDEKKHQSTGSLPKNQKSRRKSHSFHSMRAKSAGGRKRTSVALCDDQYSTGNEQYTDDERYQDHTYENLTDSIQIYESSNDVPMPAPRCKSSNSSRTPMMTSDTKHHYANIAANVSAVEEDGAEPPPIPELPSLELYSKPESIDDFLYDYKV